MDIIAKTYGYKLEYENDVPVFVKGSKEYGTYERIPYMLKVNGEVYKYPYIVVSKRMFLSLRKFYIEIVPNNHDPLTKVLLIFW